ncbi:MAG: hypothetical protein GX605_11610, partial [Chloroflexi bacterium]|nr:hypothetical protein [Chloroflexota bacterium]
VIAGLGLVWLGERLGPAWRFLIHADALAALGVACIVIYISLQLGKRATMALLDTAPDGLPERVLEQARQVPGVEGIAEIRLRESGPAVYLDVIASVDRSKSLEEAHAIATQVEERIRDAVARESDVVVHIDPDRVPDESLEQTLSALAATLGIRLHNMHAHQGRHLDLDLHAEMDESLTLAQARELLGRFEEKVRAEVPAVRAVNTHIEPRCMPTHTQGAAPEAVAQVQAAISAALGEMPAVHHCHSVKVRQAAEGLDVVLHCTTDARATVDEAHRLADQLERRLRAGVPGLGQVLVQMEEERAER